MDAHSNERNIQIYARKQKQNQIDKPMEQIQQLDANKRTVNKIEWMKWWKKNKIILFEMEK